MHADWMDVVAVVVLGCCLVAVLLFGLLCFVGTMEGHGIVPDEGEVEK